MSNLTLFIRVVDWHWAATTVIAAYAALLSTYNTYAALKKERRQVKVTVSYGYLTYGTRLSEEQMLILSASNPGHRAVTLTSAGFRLPDKRTIVLVSPDGTSLPHHLTEGTNCTNSISVREIARRLSQSGFSGTVSLVGFYRDAVDICHNSKSLLFNINESL